MGKEARNNGHQLFERPKKQCLKFLADYATQQQLYFQALTLYEARATGRHLQTDLLARRVLRGNESLKKGPYFSDQISCRLSQTVLKFFSRFAVECFSENIPKHVTIFF